MKKDDWIKLLVPVIITWVVAIVVVVLMNCDFSSLIRVMIIVVIVLSLILYILIRFFSEPDNPIKVHNMVEIRHIGNKDMIRHKLYFDNDTNVNIPLDWAYYEVKCGDKILKKGGKRYQIFEETIIGSTKRQPKDLGWVDPIEEKMDNKKEHYRIDWKIAYFYEGGIKILTSSCDFDWLQNTKDEKGYEKLL